MTDDAELERMVRDIRAGEESALNTLIQRIRNRVRTWATRYAGDGDAAEDIVQDVMINLGRNVRGYRSQSRFSTWLFAITRRTALTQARTQSRRARLWEGQLAGETDRTSPDVRLDERMVNGLILECFDRLPSKQRLIFELVELRGKAPADVARELHMPAPTVRANLFKARKAIRARMLELHAPLLEEFFS